MNFFGFTKLGRPLVLAAALAVGAASGVSALEMNFSVGGGNFFAGDFGGGFGGKVSNSTRTVTLDVDMKELGGGIYYFFDLTYAELSVGVFGGGSDWIAEQETVTAAGQSSKVKLNWGGALLRADLDIGLLLKYPLALSDAILLSPAAGMDYQICVLGNLEDTDVTGDGDLSRFWFKFGAMADFYFSEKIFVRPVLLYGIGLENKIEKKQRDSVLYNISSQGGSVSKELRHGMAVKFGIGFKL